MAKTNRSKKSSTRGKGKVTPVQVAFIVERYLEGNNYTNALTAFRSDAAGVLPKVKSKELPKGLLGLEDILDEYIKMKEDRIAMDQEKRRVEAAFKGLQEVMTNYNIMPQSPSHLGTNPNGCSPSQGQMVHGSFFNGAQPPIPDPKQENRRYPIRATNSSSSEKRKATTSARNPPPPKKHQPRSVITYPAMEGSMCNNQVNAEKRIIQASSTQADSTSPKTPAENQSLNAIISSETIIISPVKGKSSFYSVERSYQVSSASPLKKLSPWKSTSNKREQIKGRLDFDKPCDPQSSTDIIAVENSSPGNNTMEEAANQFDFELPDFSIFDDFSILLEDIDFDCQQAQTSQSSDNADSFACFEQNVNADFSENQAETCHDMSISTEGMVPLKDMETQNVDAMTTMRSITKRITISSPCKSGKITLKQVNSPRKASSSWRVQE